VNRSALRNVRHLRLALLVAVASGLVLVGCAKPAGPTAGRVTGSVVVREGNRANCPNCLVPDPAKVAFNGGKRTRYFFRQVVTARTGRFRATLPPGVYMVRAFTSQPGGGLCGPAKWIRITAGRTIQLRLICIFEVA
jgi:hypothetical protein